MRATLSRLRDRVRAIDARDPLTWVVAVFILLCLGGANWNLPCTDSWHNDALAPRPAGLGAVVETWHPGHFFRYPPLQLLALTVLSLPWILLGVLRAGTGQDALLRELIEPRYMTPIDIIGRVVSLALAVGVVVNVRTLVTRLWGDRAGLAAGIVTALNPIFVYFAHSANSDIPNLFWITLALVELDRVMAGEARERRALLYICASLLTKDQSIGVFLLAAPWALLVGPVLTRAERTVREVVFRPALWRSVALSAGVYLLVAGAITNPIGYVRRLRWITGPANKDWVVVGRDLVGYGTMAREIIASTPLFASWAVALCALVGLVLAFARPSPSGRLRAALPLVAALSYLVFFVFPSRWTMERHLMPLALCVLVYAGVVFARAWDAAASRARPVVVALFALALAPQLRDAVSVDATLAFDARHAAQRFLASLSPGTTVEIYGGNQYLPNLPRHLRVTRVGPEPDADRSPLPGVTELRAPFREVTVRAPDYALVGEDFGRLYLPTDRPLSPFLERLNRDPDGRALMTGLLDGSLGYTWALRARCELPWPLRCVRLHLSTGAEVWIFRRSPRS